MKNLSPVQACLIWDDLVEAYHGNHPYGSDVAELYAYRFMRYDPVAHANVAAKDSKIFIEAQNVVVSEAAQSLYEILALFQKTRDCEILIQDWGKGAGAWYPLGTWVANILFDHRIHVRIVPKK